MLNQLNKFFGRIIILTGFVLLLSACDNRPNGVLSQSKMADVLSEMHKADATMQEKGIAYGHYSNKAPYYKFIFNKYHVTQAQFDSSLVWYTKNPREFENIYDKVLVNLSSLQKDVKNGKYHPVDTLDLSKMRTNIWNKHTNYLFTKDSVRSHFDFEITGDNLMYRDRYVLSFLQRIAPEDSCKSQRIVLRINYANGNTDSVSSKAYNDSLLRRYTFHFSAKRKLKIKSLSGELLASKLYKGKMNAVIDSITLYREYNSKKQDSLRKVVEMATRKIKITPKKIINPVK